MFRKGDLLEASVKKLGPAGEIIGLFDIKATAFRDGDSLSDIRIDYSSMSMKELRENFDKYKIEWCLAGNRIDKTRQSSIEISGIGSKAPEIVIRDGVSSFELSESDASLIGIIGKLEGRNFMGKQMEGSGIACKNVYLSGNFSLENGSTIEESVFNDHILADASFVSLNQKTVTNENTLVIHASLIQQNAYEINQRVTTSVFNTLTQRVESAESSISQKADSITFETFKTSTNTELNKTVKKNQVIFELNSTTETAQIQASKINFIGLSTFRTSDSPNRLEIQSGAAIAIYSNNMMTGGLLYNQLFLNSGVSQTQINPGNAVFINQPGSVYIEDGKVNVTRVGNGETNIFGGFVNAYEFSEYGTPMRLKYANKIHSHSDYAASNHTHSDYDSRITSITNRFNTFENSTLSGIQANICDLRTRVSRIEQGLGYQ